MTGGESPPLQSVPGSAGGEESAPSAAGFAAEDGSARPTGQDAACSPMLQGVMFHALESRNDGVLWDVQPSCVVMVDSDVAFVRQLEVLNLAVCNIKHYQIPFSFEWQSIVSSGHN